MKVTTLILFFIGLCNVPIAKAAKLDSLLTELNSFADSSSSNALDIKSILCNSIGVQYQGIDDNKARVFFLQSIKFAKERIDKENDWNIQNNYDMAYLYKNMATFESTLGNNVQASSYMGIAENHYKQLKSGLSEEEFSQIMISFYSSNTGLFYHQKEWELAEEAILKAERLAEETNMIAEQTNNYRLHGEIYAAQKKYEIAKTYFFKSIDLIDDLEEPSGIDIDYHIYSLVVAFYKNENYKELIAFLENRYPYRTIEERDEYTSIKNPIGIPSFIENLFILSFAKDKLYKKNQDKHLLNESLRNKFEAFKIAENYILNNNFEEIAAAIRNPKNRILSLFLNIALRKEQGINSIENTFDLLRIIDVYHANRLHLERSSFALNKTLWEQQKTVKNDLNFVTLKLNELTKKDSADNAEMDELQQRAFELNAELQSLENKTKKEKLAAQYKVEQSDFKEKIKAFVSTNNKTLLTYFYTESRDSIFIIGVNADTSFIVSKVVPIDFKTEINELYQLNSMLLIDPEKIERQRALNMQFYEYLIQPIEGYFNSTELTVYPLNEISYISFDALINSSDEYLVKNYSVHYISSLFSVINSNPVFTDSEKPFSLFSPSDYGVDSLNELFYADAEVRTIETYLEGEIYDQNQATKGNFLSRAKKDKIIHLASHSILDLKHPYESYLLFDDNGDNENKLFAYEIFSLTLSADLLTLSTCNSGNGEIEEGIGSISLSNAFYFAGVPSIISSLWNTQDKSSSEIMIRFYQNLKNGDSKSESLRQAKLHFLENADKIQQQPFFWANYFLYGDDQKLYEKKSNWNYYVFGGIITLGLFGIIFGYWRSRKTRLASS